MRMTKFTHACVRLTDANRSLVIDPGGWSEAESLDGLTAEDAILITHEHPDHLDAAKLAASPAPIWTNSAVAAVLRDADAAFADRITEVADGDQVTAAGFDVRVFGEDHAVILPELGVPCVNTAFLVGGAVYHPGDSWTVPDRPVAVNLLPISAPWFATPAAVQYAREVRAERLVPIHDALLSDLGRGLYQRIVGEAAGGKEYVAVTPGDSIEVS